MFSYDRNKSLGHLTGLANRLLSNRLARSFRESGIDMTAEQWGSLLVLINGGAMTQGQFGEKLCLEKSSVSRLLNGLERRGWIIRKISEDDSRQKLVSVTENAVKTAEKCASIATAVLEEAQKGLSEDERLVCRSFLSRIISNLE